MAAFFQILFFIFLLGIIVVGLFLYHTYKRIHDSVNRFRNQMEGNYQSQGSHERRTAHGQRYDGDKTIIDMRDPQKAHRKIFPQGEGEYMDFKEIKD